MGGIRVLAMADAGIATEQALLDGGVDVRADLLIVGRHSGDPVGSPAFLDAVRPAAVIAGAAAFPESERISPAWEAVLARRGVPLFRQDLTGAVSVRVGRRGVRLDPFLASEIPGMELERGGAP
jgi:competence protein ComEC